MHTIKLCILLFVFGAMITFQILAIIFAEEKDKISITFTSLGAISFSFILLFVPGLLESVKTTTASCFFKRKQKLKKK